MTLVLAAPVRLIALSKRADTATPWAASEGLTSLEPELSRASDLASMSWLDCRLEAADNAWIFVLMTIWRGVFVLVPVCRRGIARRLLIGQLRDSARAGRQGRFV